MAQDNQDLLGQVADYYDDKLTQHGATARGVDWNGVDSQHLRFDQLARVIDRAEGFSVNDLGCGYGAFQEYLAGHYGDFDYNGYDVSSQMIEAANRRLPKTRVHLACTATPDRTADYTVASGIFNVRMDRADDEWQAYFQDTLDAMNSSCTRGFAFNCLTAYSDADRMRDYLYYTSPTWAFDLCKTRYARNVALLHDYGLYEFTLIVRKDP
ncbi:MAG: methyltransferase domain-containing protein [Pseudomonadota bacterium]